MTALDSWDLGATCRCLIQDLAFPPAACAARVEELADSRVIRAFLERRNQSPEGQETIQELQPQLTAYSLHVGRYRGATWYDRAAAVCWLLAVGIHRDDSREDAYAYFASLQEAHVLLPTERDVLRVVERRQPSFEAILTKEIPDWRVRAMAHRGQVLEAILGNRVRVRLTFENGDAGILTIAISSNLLPDGPPVPEGWYEALLAAFLPDSETLDIAFDLAGQPLRADEDAFCGLVTSG